jgi:hypothetical protein
MRKFGTSRSLPDKPSVQSFVIPAGSFLAGLVLYQIVRPVGLYIRVAAAAMDVQLSLRGGTDVPDGPARSAVDERMEKRRSRANCHANIR